jgi:hypothetical protein
MSPPRGFGDRDRLGAFDQAGADAFRDRLKLGHARTLFLDTFARQEAHWDRQHACAVESTEDRSALAIERGLTRKAKSGRRPR